MEAAKAAINKVIGRGGQHDTTVDENVNPAVTQETVKPTRHENITEAVDKEVHQDHYHTTVQPLADREVLSEQHRHQQMPVQEKEYRHGDDSHVNRSVNAEAAQFKDSTRMTDTTHSQTQAPTVAGEHVHHHVHENVQPVIHKETIAPEVVHTTSPVHERHQAPSEHHGMSVLPSKTLSEAQHGDRSLASGSHRQEHYEGDPRTYTASMQAERADIDKNFAQHDGLHGASAAGGNAGRVALGSSTAAMGGRQGHDIASGNTGTDRSTAGYGGSNYNSTTATGVGSNTTSNVGQGHSSSTSQSQPHEQNLSHDRTTHGGSGGHGITDQTTHGGSGSGHGTTDQTTHSGSGHGHGITNQLHHGSARDNITSNDSNVQHGTQPRDPAVVGDQQDHIKLTGSGVDGSHSALFGLTPDGHKHEDTSSHGPGKLQPGHSTNKSSTSAAAGGNDSQQRKLADQMQDVRVSEKSHGLNTTDAGSGKPGAGVPGSAGSQGFGNVRADQHGSMAKMEDRMDPTTDADRDGKRGVMD